MKLNKMLNLFFYPAECFHFDHNVSIIFKRNEHFCRWKRAPIRTNSRRIRLEFVLLLILLCLGLLHILYTHFDVIYVIYMVSIHKAKYGTTCAPKQSTKSSGAIS